MTEEKAAPAQTVNISCNFIGDFEVADNMVRNAQALCGLKAANKGGVFNKLIVIQAGSIVEVALAQIIYRAQISIEKGYLIFPKRIDWRSRIRRSTS